MRHRFEFQIFARATRVERGTDQLSNVSARLCAVICFAPPLPLLFHLPSPRSTISSGFYLWRHRLRIGIDSVIYSRTDRLSSTGRSISSRENDRERERLARNRILSKTSFSFESLPPSLSLRDPSLLTSDKFCPRLLSASIDSAVKPARATNALRSRKLSPPYNLYNEEVWKEEREARTVLSSQSPFNEGYNLDFISGVIFSGTSRAAVFTDLLPMLRGGGGLGG